MIILFIMMGIGFFCGHKGYMTDSATKHMSWIVINIATPAMIIGSGMDRNSGIKDSSLLFVFILSFAIYLFLILFAYVLMPLMKIPVGDRGVYRVMAIFSNIGFMGFPIVKAAYGDDALLYAALFQFPYNFLIYTYGIASLRGENPFKAGFKPAKFLNAGVISCIIAIVLFLTRIPMPLFVTESAERLGDLAAPLSMMVIGQSMIHINTGSLIRDVRLLVFSLIKLTVIPIAGVLILRLFIADPMILHVCFVMLATPIGSMTAMLPRQYGGDYKLASRGVALSTIMSVITIPLVSLVLFGR